MLTDSELLAQFARDRSEEALRTLFDRHLKLVYAAALRQVHDPGMAEDIVQGVFLALADKAPVLANRAMVLPAWLLTATRFAALSALRRRAAQIRFEKKGAVMEHQPPPTVDSEKLSSIIDAAMNRLSGPDRTAIAVYYLENQSLRDLGAVLAISEAAAHKRISRALLRLRNILIRQGVTCPSDALEASLHDLNSVVVSPALLATAVNAVLHPSPSSSNGLAVAHDIFRSLLMKKVKAFALSTLVTAIVAVPTVALVYHAFSSRPSPAAPVLVTTPVNQASTMAPANIPKAWGSDIFQRILSLNSLDLKGVIYAPDGVHPIELYAQQPDLCRIKGFNGSQSTDVIITAEHVLTIDPVSKTATIEPENRSDAEYQVADILQNGVQMLFGGAQNFKQLRSETLSGIQTDVYQGQIPEQGEIDVWVNPVTGLPVKTAFYQPDSKQPDQPIGEFDTIEFNPSIPAAVFAPKIPPDYTIIQSKPIDAVSGGGLNGSSAFTYGNMHACIRYSIALGNGDVLMCWYLYDDRNPADDLKLPDAKNTLTITSMTGVVYSEHLLHADVTPQGYHWRWSLLRPAKSMENSATMISVMGKDASGSEGDDVISPVIFLPKDLPERVKSLQLLTLPAGYAPMTLSQIEALSEIEPAPAP
ncbi:MAG TPA: sigma-70 family RNA polymerase sigma factor [Phycisphaerae bacterium]|nr:sigma-70 family RNA polymerase sigma factor [Phycisphaerae bacterium]